jgi:hypothetical protein
MDEVKLKRSRFEVMMFLTSYGLLVPVAISLFEAHIWAGDICNGLRIPLSFQI